MSLTPSEKMLQTGEKAPNFNLLGVDGKYYSLDSFEDKKLLLVVFMCNHCPYVIAKIKDLVRLQDKYREDLAIVGINSNDVDEYEEDSYENMKKFVKERGINFTYLFDETQETARIYGASCTPDPFLFDENRNLVFHGRINDAMEPNEEVTDETMDEAISNLLDGVELISDFVPSIGCSIKWK